MRSNEKIEEMKTEPLAQLFQKGDVVRHQLLGAGVVQSRVHFLADKTPVVIVHFSEEPLLIKRVLCSDLRYPCQSP